MKVRMNSKLKNIKIPNIFKIFKSTMKKEKDVSMETSYIDTELLNEIIDEDIKRENKMYKRKGANRSYNIYRFKGYMGNLFKNKKNLTAGYYMLLVGMVILGTASVGITIKASGIFSKEKYEVYGNADNNKTDESSITTNGSETPNTSDQDNSSVSVISNVDNTKIDKPVVNNSTTTKTNTTTQTPSKPVIQPLVFAKPLNGQIIKPYSIDKVIYSKTLELWKTHDGLDIAGNIGDSVKSIERGTVEKVYDDSFYGTTIIIDHGQGYKSMYANLDASVSVKAKQTVKKGQVIGKVGNTAIGEIKDEPHVHIQLFKDGNVIDPTTKF